MKAPALLLMMLALAGTGCRTAEAGKGGGVKSVDDIQSMDYSSQLGKFIVICKYHGPGGQPELATADQITSNQVCNGGPGGGGGIGMAMACNYSNGQFKVIRAGQSYETSVGRQPPHARHQRLRVHPLPHQLRIQARAPGPAQRPAGEPADLHRQQFQRFLCRRRRLQLQRLLGGRRQLQQ